MSRVLPVALVSAAVFVAGVIGWLSDWHVGADSAAYRAGATALLRGEQLYSTEALSASPSWAVLPFTYPPAAALLFVPLALLPIQVGWGVLGALSVGALAVVVGLTIRTVGDAGAGRPNLLPTPASPTGRLPKALLPSVLALLPLALEPVWRTVLLGQINLLLMAVVMVDMLVLCGTAGRASRWGGVLIGVAAAVKLTPLIFVVHLVIVGRWAPAVRAVATFVALQVTMFLLVPGPATVYWTEAGTDPNRIGRVYWIFNQSLNGLVNRLSEAATWSTAVALGIGAVLAVPAAILLRRLARDGMPVEALLVSAFLALLVSPVSWTHHWVWAVPLIVVLAARARWAQAAAVFVVFASCVIMIVPNGGRLEFDWNAAELIFGSTYLLVPVVAAAVLAWRGVVIARTVRTGFLK